jgi:hypothetical protein
MTHVVKMLTDDDGYKHQSNKWHYVHNASGSNMTLCTNEVFGVGEGEATYQEKQGKDNLS